MIGRLAKFVLVALAVVALVAVLAVAIVVVLAAGSVWALGRLVGGFVDTARSIEQVYR